MLGQRCVRCLRLLARAQSTCVGAFRQKAKVDNVTLVTDAAAADRALAVLERLPDRAVAWDTETAGVQLRRGAGQSPCLHGRVVCATAYCGDDVDFGSGPRLLIDNIGPEGGLLAKFSSYFEDPKYKKVFHNYTFDRHVLKRAGCAVQGLAADTLILARVHDTAKGSWEGNARALQTQGQERMMGSYMFAKDSEVSVPRSRVLALNFGGQKLDMQAAGFHSMALPMPKETARAPPRLNPYGSYDLKSLSKAYELVGDADEVQRFPFGAHENAAEEAFNSPEQFQKFVEYATLDSVLTYKLFHRLKLDLSERAWNTDVHKKPVSKLLLDDAVAEELRRYRKTDRKTLFSITAQKAKPPPTSSLAGTPGSVQRRTGKTMWDFFQENLLKLPECLARMEERGVAADAEVLKKLEVSLKEDFEQEVSTLKAMLAQIRRPDGSLLNEKLDFLNIGSSLQLQTLLFGGAPNRSDNRRTLEEEREFPTPQGAPQRRFAVTSLGLQPGSKRKDFTEKGWPSTSKEALARLRLGGQIRRHLEVQGWPAEEVQKVETAFAQLEKCRQIQNAVRSSKPLREAVVEGRIHPSWQFNTSTGRLTCSKPNLQNLVSGTKDIYGIRSAFRARPGHKLVMADYSQLELRILAHIANCMVMATKIQSGSDYHSEVAAEIFDHVREAQAVASGRVSTFNTQEDSVKSRFPKERTYAKAINFGIIYGKTAPSLAEDLGISAEEADNLIKAWFQSKPAVQRWKTEIERLAESEQISLSLLGRERHLPLLDESASPSWRNKAKRAAVNYAIQGSAADIVTAVMLQLDTSEALKATGFQMVMQVHDEIILEGPATSSAEAAEILKKTMEAPFQVINPDYAFRVPLEVNIAIGDTLQTKA